MRATGGADFFDGVSHFGGGHELAFLDVDRLAGLTAGSQQIGLAGEEGGHLQNVDDGGHLRDLRALVYIRQHGHAKFIFDAMQDDQTVFKTRPSKAVDAGSIGFVEAGFEDVGEAKFIANLLDVFTDR